ncbi:hypothetical protein Gogos_019835, partial [Gossypium gossypioides]|nr:hypothetical protein [Gossypium gossypioides]
VVHRFQAYLLELDVIKQWLPGRLIGAERWRPPDPPFIKVNFEAAYSGSDLCSCAGIVIRDHTGHYCHGSAPPQMSLFVIPSHRKLGGQSVGINGSPGLGFSFQSRCDASLYLSGSEP